MSVGEFIVRAVACIKPVSELPDPAETAADADQSPVVDLLGHGLAVVYLVDEGDRFVYVQHHHLKAIGAPARGLMSIGLANLEIMAGSRLRMIEAEGVVGLTLDGHFEASLLLVDRLWDEIFASRLPNGVVAAIPARDVLGFCDAASQSGIAMLRQMIASVLPRNDHLISDQLWHRVDGAWEPYVA